MQPLKILYKIVTKNKHFSKHERLSIILSSANKIFAIFISFRNYADYNLFDSCS